MLAIFMDIVMKVIAPVVGVTSCTRFWKQMADRIAVVVLTAPAVGIAWRTRNA